MTNNSLKNRILIPFTLGLFSLLVVFLVSLFWIERNTITIRVKHQFESSEHFFTSQQENDARLLIGVLESIMNDRGIQTALKTKDRQALLSQTTPLFKRIAAYHPVTHLYFSDAQRIILLRVHQPDRYGDRIDRVTTLRAEKTGTIAYGLELGPLGTLTLRVVAPMFVDGKRIGFVELGEEIDHITAKFKKFFGVEMIMHLHKKFLHRPGWEAGMKMLGRAYDWDRFPDVVLVEQTLPVNPEALSIFFSEGSHGAQTNDVEIVSQNRRFRGRFLFIKDVQGVSVGDMIVLIDVTGQVTRLYYTMGVIALFSVFLGGVLFFLFRFYLGRVENQLTSAQQKIIDLEKDRTRMESEAKFYSVAQSVNDAMISSDPSGRITFWNPAAVEMFGYPEEEVLGQPLTRLIPERYREAHLKGMERVQTGGEPRMIGKTTELFGVKKDGTEFPLELSLARWTAGEETFYTGFIRDITQRKQAEESLRESEEKYRELYDFLPIPVYEMDFEANITSANRAIYETFRGTEEDLKKGFKAWQLLSPEDIDKSIKNIERLLKGEKIQDTEYSLMRLDGAVFPAIVISRVIYSDGKPVGLRGAIVDITERKRTEEALRESEKKHREMVDFLPISIVEIDLKGNIVSFNYTSLEVFGYKKEDYEKGMKSLQFFEPKEWERLGENIEKVIKGTSVPGQEFTFLRKDGSTFPGLIYASLIIHENEPVGIRGAIIDITERKRIDEALRESEEKYRTILESIEDGYYEVDLAGNLTFFNDAMARINGYSRDEMMGMNNRKYTDAENSKLLYRYFNRVYQTGGTSKGIVYEVITKNGGRKSLETSISLIRDLSGKPIGFRGIARDVTELRQAQRALLESEDLYRDLVENSQDLIYTHDLEGNLLSVNEAPVRLLGYSHESLLHMNLGDLLIPELRDQLGAYLKEIQGQGQAKGIMRVQTATGETHYWEYNNTLRTEGVAVPIVRGMAHDVTERIRAEKEVRETLKKLRRAMGGIIQAITLTVESRDPYTAGHQKRVSNLARSIAQEIGMPVDQIEAVRLAGMVHDLGKISIPAEILSKPSRLSDIEFKLIQGHPQTSYDILKDIDFPWPIARIVLQHHERMDGSGYPAGLKGDEILREAKVLMVADVVEAIASHRPYRPAFGIEKALEEIEKNKGILYDQPVAEACLGLFREKGFQFEGK